MPRLKLTKTTAESAAPDAKEYELRDTVTPGFLLKIMPSGRKMFMVAARRGDEARRHGRGHGQDPVRRHRSGRLLSSALNQTDGSGDRLTASRMSVAGLVQTKGLALRLCSAM